VHFLHVGSVLLSIHEDGKKGLTGATFRPPGEME